MKRSSIPLTLALSVALLLGFSVIPANAQWFGNSPGSRADARSASITASNFATQQGNLRSQINSAVSRGSIPPGEAAQLTSQLDQANAMSQNALASGNMTNDLANAVLGIFSNVGNALSGATAMPWGSNANFYANPYGGYAPY